MKKAIISIFILLVFSGCKMTYRVVLGIDSSPNWQVEETIAKKAKKRKIPIESLYILDTASYRTAIVQELNITYKKLKVDSFYYDTLQVKNAYQVAKDDLQPTQVRFFKRDKTEIFKLVNCYIDPPIPMNWNVNKCFDVFPPKIDIESLNTHKHDLDFFLNHLTNLEGDSVKFSDLPNSDYYVVVFWNSFFLKPSKKLIKTVNKYIDSHPEVKIEPLYVNNHNAELWSNMDSVQKAKVVEYLNSTR